MEKSDRSFTIHKCEVAMPSETSRYISKTPAGAAAKAARRIFASVKNTKKEQIRFTIRETTQGSAGKMYRYIGLREKFAEPKVINIGGKEVSITHNFKVKSCRLDE